MIPAEFALIDQPELALKLRCQLIRGARSRIQAQYYSWEEDSSGKLLLAELLHAARRGVRVQLLIDDLYAGDNRFLEMVAHQPGIEVRLFNPFWLRGWRPLTPAAGRAAQLSPHQSPHAQQAAAGGRQSGGDRRSQHRGPLLRARWGRPSFVDLDLACRGPLCQQAEQGFDQFWRSRWSHPIRRLLRRPLQRAEVQVVNDFLLTMNEPQVAAVYDLPASLFDPEPVPLRWHGGEAELADNQGKLSLVTPYLILTRGLRRRLRQQRQAGVNIDILTNSLASTDVPLVYGAYRRHPPLADTQGIALSELEGESLSLHAKLILAGEEEALLGSFNLDPRSLLLNTELVLHLACPALCAELQQWLATWQQRSSHSVAAPPSTLRRLLARVSDWLPLQRWL
ncbi:UNVERIFIED_CONTAM: hypothetical protein K2H54_000297 [Gekko kuhli]